MYKPASLHRLPDENVAEAVDTELGFSTLNRVSGQNMRSLRYAVCQHNIS